MAWQLTLSVALVAAAAGYLAWRGWRTWRASRAGCAGGCGCAKAPADGRGGLIPAEQLTVRRLKGREGTG